MADSLCSKCQKRWLETETEIETGICGHCADRLIAKYRDRQEFEEYHPDPGN